MGIRIIKKPAENNMYTCKDKYAGFGLPFSCANDQLAIQAFKAYCLTDEDGEVRAPYLELYKCGYFNRDTGEYRNCKMKLLQKGAKYAELQKRVQRENKNTSASGK